MRVAYLPNWAKRPPPSLFHRLLLRRDGRYQDIVSHIFSCGAAVVVGAAPARARPRSTSGRADVGIGAGSCVGAAVGPVVGIGVLSAAGIQGRKHS